MADQKTIEQRVKEIIVNQLNVNEEQITPTASFLDDLGADSLDTVPLKRFGEAADIAAATVFLCSEEAGYVTGQVFAVDGGMAM